MGSVYVARQHSMDRDVAIKIMHHRADGNHASVQRFFWEVRAARRLQNPHTISVFDFGQTERGSLYLAMELLKGTTLGHLLSVEHRIKPALALRIGIQICRSLEEAHAKSIIHRDLKPENIFLVHRNNQSDFVKVLDFGVAKFLDPEDNSQLTQTGTVFGTPRYMSPEQANSEPVDARSDLYALGIMLYEMLSGKVPFNEDNALELLYKQVHAKPTPLCQVAPWMGLDEGVGAIVDALLEKRREDRPQSATDVREQFEKLLAELPEDGGEPPPLPSGQISPAMKTLSSDYDPDAPRPGRSANMADTQQGISAREVLRRQMDTPSLGIRTSHDGNTSWPTLVGRREESTIARRALDQALDGAEGRFLWITGERGVGKSRVVRWLLAAAQKDLEALVAQGRASGTVVGIMPEIRAAMENLLGVTLLERTALRQSLEDHPAFSDRIENDLIEGLTNFLRPSLDDEAVVTTTLDGSLMGAVTRLLVRVSKLQPVVLDVGLLNSVHATTLRYLEHLAATLEQTPARVCVIARVDTTARTEHRVLNGVLEHIGWQGSVKNAVFRHAGLGRLEGEDFLEYLQSLGKVYIHLVDYLRYLSGGNPEIAATLVRQIEAEPERINLARMWNPVGDRTAMNDLPPELVDSAERQLAAALSRVDDSKAAKGILRRAALIGYEFEIGFLEDVLEREGREDLVEAMEETLESLISTACLLEVEDGERARFDNGILRELVLGRIRSRRTLKHLHALIAQTIEARPDEEIESSCLELATHFACSGDLNAALDYRLRYARRSRADGSTETALQAYISAGDTAREILKLDTNVGPANEAEQEIVLELARIHFELGLYEQSAESYQRLKDLARAVGSDSDLAHAERGLGEVQDALAEYGGAAELFRSAAERFQAMKEPLEAAWCELKRAGSLERRGNVVEARAGYQKARQVFARFKHQGGLADAYNALGMLSLAEGDSGEALRQLRRAVDIYSKVGAGLDLGKALYHLALAATERRDLLMALDAANKALEIFDREDYRTGISQCLGTIARVLITQRRPAEARPYFERALRIREDLGDRRGVAEAVARLADIALALEQPERALELAFRARDIYGACGEFLGAASALKTMGLAQHALARYDDALSFLREAVATYESLSARDGELCLILQSLAECQTAMGLRADARETLSRALEVARDLQLSHQTGHLEARLRAMGPV